MYNVITKYWPKIILISSNPRMHKFSKNLEATSKFQVPGGRKVTSCKFHKEVD
jgi:hypothetical protein